MFELISYRSSSGIAFVRETLRAWWGLELSGADAAGNVVDLEPARDRVGGVAVTDIAPPMNRACQLVVSTAAGDVPCRESVRGFVAALAASGPGVASVGSEVSDPIVSRCHIGLRFIAAPIWLGETFAGCVYVSGLLDVDADELTDVSAKLRVFTGMSAADGASELATVPRLTVAERRRVVDLLRLAVTTVSDAWAREKTPSNRASSRNLEKKAAVDAEAVVPSTDDGAAHPFTEIVGRSTAVRSMTQLLAKIVKTHSTVLIHGESGTGKELIARAIHFHGPRAKKPFVVQNCSAFNDNLLESALFGHARGSFTGAVKDQKGLFEVADGGTFFLDEIGDMSPSLQVKLLRVLQEGTFTPVGGTKPVKVDVRIIAASHKDLTQMVAQRQFREDLYYRVNVLKLTVPPLRDRPTDIPILTAFFLKKHQLREGQSARLSGEALAALVNYPWPGNIRELENEIERALVLGGDRSEIGLDVLSTRLLPTGVSASTVPGEAMLGGHSWAEIVDSMEADALLRGLSAANWQLDRLARAWGVSQEFLALKCARFGLERPA